MIKGRVIGIPQTLEHIEKEQKKFHEQVKTRISNEILQELKAATPVDTGEARDGWRLQKHVLINDVDHIVPLNEGSSQQAPAHFVEKTVLNRRDVKLKGIIVEK